MREIKPHTCMYIWSVPLPFNRNLWFSWNFTTLARYYTYHSNSRLKWYINKWFIAILTVFLVMKCGVSVGGVSISAIGIAIFEWKCTPYSLFLRSFSHVGKRVLIEFRSGLFLVLNSFQILFFPFWMVHQLVRCVPFYYLLKRLVFPYFYHNHD